MKVAEGQITSISDLAQVIVVIDIHAHTFPYVGSPSGRDSVKAHMRHIQHHIVFRAQGFRRREDGKLVEMKVLFDGVNDGVSGMHEVCLKVGRYGWSGLTREKTTTFNGFHKVCRVL